MSPPLLSRRNGAHRTPARAACPTLGRRFCRIRFPSDFPKEDFMRAARPTFGAFNQGGVPTIACFNRASTPLGVDFDALIAAMQAFVDRCVMPVWGTPARLVKSKGYVKGAWAMV